ncbi:amidohydrolase family protein [Streptomyces sp. NPDC060209]|uniref:amidohydrolase family protein n=1 Tax=Streptomyces sp. NPDC060209 TaxID=3347073 RepID=UPI003662DD32
MPDQPIFDAHLHIIDPQHPLVPNRGFAPDPFPAETYQESVANLGVRAGAVVSGSFQAFDQGYLIDALKRLGPSYVGVTQLPSTVTDAELTGLRDKGVRAIRFNLFRGGSAKLEELEELARRAYDVAGWHTEFYVHSRDLPDLEDRLTALPKFSIDHLGMADDGFDTLLRLVEQGARVKATGFGRIAHDPAEAMRRINQANPHALMFGTDLPSTRADRPFRPIDIDLVVETLGEKDATRALWTNALEFYGVERPG